MINNFEAEVTRVYMTHESGTKFYQIFEFTGPLGLSVTVSHYGPVGRVKDKRPVTGGQTSIKKGRKLHELQLAKEKRGYSQLSSEKLTVGMNGGWVTETFGASLAHSLAVQLNPSAEVIEPRELVNNSSISKPAEPEVPRPEAWGSW